MSKEDFLFIFKHIGENIRSTRDAQNLSQEELAFRIRSARNYVGCIERAEKFPSIIMLYKIAKALNVKLSDLIKDL